MAYKCLEDTEVICSICEKKPAAIHHIVKRGSAPFLIECIYNMKGLCEYHHTGQGGPHKIATFDIELKKEMQQKLEFLFCEEYYSKANIKRILGIKEKDVDQLCKLLKWNQEGYRREDIIFRCMGGKNYL